MPLHITYKKALIDNYIWVLFNESKAIVIDPGESKEMIKFLNDKNLSLECIILTHGHDDHINGVVHLKQKYPNAILYVPDELKLGLDEIKVREGDELFLIESTFKIIELPGHSNNHIGIIYKDNLFCGDVLFSAGCGRVSDNKYIDMHSSLERIKMMDDNTKIYFSHEYTLENLIFANQIEPENKHIKRYIEKFKISPSLVSAPTTLRFEKKINPFLRLSEKIGRDNNLNNSLDIFIYLRKLKDKFVSKNSEK
ncbi:hydroxyacylglutathione hydrolase [Vibrio sp. TRT 1302]|uniref:hydroxyacylglutathione hydrolase n=1 Tax=Vibrio sp. TRT 1302 TaxID=3418504 RepID=UPI003CEF69B8